MWVVGVDGVVLGHGLTKGSALQAADRWSARSNPLESAVLLEATPALAAVLASPSCPPHPRYRVRSDRADVLTRGEALAELDLLNAEAEARQAEFERLAAEGERRFGPDPLGYDTDRPIEDVAREMAKDALSGRNREAVEAELARFRSRRRKTDR